MYRQDAVASVIQSTSRRPSLAVVLAAIVGVVLAGVGGLYVGHEYHPATKAYLQQTYPEVYNGVVVALGGKVVGKHDSKGGKAAGGKPVAGKVDGKKKWFF